MAHMVYSVGGIHPVEGSLAYAAYQCFRTPEDADQWRVAARAAYGPLWSLSDVMQSRAEFPASDLPTVETLIERLNETRTSCPTP